jgi:hypothetical protein
MKGNSIKLDLDGIPADNSPRHLVTGIPGAVSWDSCNQESAKKADAGYDYIQKIIPQNQVYTQEIQLAARGSNSNILRISLLNSCYQEIAFFEGTIDNSSEVIPCHTSTYLLNKPVQIKKGENYYIRVKSSNNLLLFESHISALEEETYPEDYHHLNLTQEEMNLTIHGFDPRLNKTVSEYLDEVTNFLNETYKMGASYEVGEYNLIQNNPWGVNVQGEVIVSLNDSFFSVKKVLPFDVEIGLEELPDPLFYKYRVEREIKRHPPKKENEWNITDLQEIFLNESYLKDGNSPKFLDRYTLNMNGSTCCGFESFIDPAIVIDPEYQHITDVNTSMVDWMFFIQRVFCQSNATRFYEIDDDGVPGLNTLPADDFNLDDLTMAKFKLSNDTTGLLIDDLCS